MAWWNPFRRTRTQAARGSASPRTPTSKELEERLLHDRIILLGTPIDDEVANRVIAQLLFLDNESPTKDIHLYLNSPGGSVTATFAICDTLEYVKPDVSTVCLGQCSGIAALLMALGERGKRFAVADSDFMLAPLMGGHRPEDAPDVNRLRQAFAERLARATRQSVARILLDCEAKRHLSASEAQHYGLVDQVLDQTRARRLPGREE